MVRYVVFSYLRRVVRQRPAVLVVVGSGLAVPLETEVLIGVLALVAVVAGKRTPHSMLAPRCTIVSSIHGSQYRWIPSRLVLPVGGTS